MIYLTIDERSHLIKSGRMAFGRKPTWISGPDRAGIMVIHVVGSLEYVEAGGQRYAPSRFIVLRVVAESRTHLPTEPLAGTIVDYDCEVVVEIAGIPKKPSKRRGGLV